MGEAYRWVALLGIGAMVLLLAWVSRRAALDVDGRGGPGWLVGWLVLVLPPIGFIAWLWIASRRSRHRRVKDVA